MGKKIAVYFITILLAIQVKGQDTTAVTQTLKPDTLTAKDSANWVKKGTITIEPKKLEPQIKFKPDSKKAVIYAAVFPGLGQIYNRKYWKLPILYGGFIALAYGFTWNGRYYNDYSDAYRAIMASDPRSTFYKWNQFIDPSYTPTNIPESVISNLKSQYKRKKDSYRRNRDLCIIGAVALYAVSIIDAYVDAQLFDFDISPDLSLKVEPTIMEPTLNSNKSFGVQCSLKF